MSDFAFPCLRRCQRAGNLPGQPVAANQVIVRLKDTSPATLAAFQASTRSGEQVQTLSRSLALNLLRSSTRNVDSLVSAFKGNASVSYVEPNYIVRGATTPNDGSYSQLWGMPLIGAPAAWDVTTGSTANVVGVVDTGVDYTHPDLAANIWSAPSASP